MFYRSLGLEWDGGSGGGGGGGGGSNGSAGGNGGSGVVIVRWETSRYGTAASTTGSPTYSTAGGFHIYTFTTSGSITI